MNKTARELTPSEVFAAENALMDFQFAVIDAMRSLNISQADLANRLGISRARVSQMLSSDANPTIKVIGRTLHVLGLENKYSFKSRDHLHNFDWDAFCIAHSRRSAEAQPIWHNDNHASNNSKVQIELRAA